MDELFRPDYRAIAIDCFRKEHGSKVKCIITNKNGTFGIIPNHILEGEKYPSAIPIYVEFPISDFYLDELYRMNS